MTEPEDVGRQVDGVSGTPGAPQKGAQWKDWLIGALSLALVGTGFLAFRGGAGPVTPPSDDSGDSVAVFDSVLDPEERKYLDILFDGPLGQAAPGEVLALPPATLDPPLAGVWRWRHVNVLRFEPSGGFPVASEYDIQLIPERLLGEDQSLSGDKAVMVKTDPFLVEGVTLEEVPVADSGSRVTFRGQIKFNYSVDPEVLAPLIRLEDSLVPGEEGIEVNLENPYWTRDAIGFRTAPVAKTKAERQVRLVMSAELTPSVGNVSLGRDFVEEIPVGSSEILKVRKVTSEPGSKESRIQVVFSSPVEAGVASSYVEIEPKVRYRLSSDRNRLTLTGAFRPGKAYRLKLAEGLPARDEAVLKQGQETKVQLADLPPSVDFESQGLFLSARGNHNIAVESVNVQQVRLSVDRVYLNNLFFLIDYGGGLSTDSTYYGDTVSRALGDRIAETRLGLDSQRNEPAKTVLSLDPYLQKGKKGLYRVLLSRPGDWQAAQRWLLLTDLGAVAKKGEGEITVWISSSRDLSPVSGARVTLVSDQNQTLAQGFSDGAGRWRFRNSEALKKNRPFLITFEKGEDFGFLYLNRMGIDTTGLDVAGAPPLGDGYTAFLYGERDLYRPGETAKGLALVRSSKLEPPVPMPAILRHRDPQGRLRGTQRLGLDAKGIAEFSLDLPAYALTGHHSLELVVAEQVIGQYRFQVEDFIPDRIKVEIDPASPQVSAGGELAYEVASAYLFGPPSAGLQVESRVRLVSSNFVPPGLETYTFGDSQRKWEDREILFQEGALGEDGRRSFRVPTPLGSEAPSSLAALITARVQESGGRGVTAVTRVPVHPFPYYLGLRRLQEGYGEPGEEASFEFVAVNAAGEEMKAGELRAELFLERWNTVLRRTPSGTYRYQSSREAVSVDSQSVSAGKSRGQVTFRPADYGSHRLVLSDPATGASAVVQFYVSGWGYSPWAVENPARVELDLDREEYRPGEVATVQVRAPFPGKLLLTVEHGRVLDSQVYTLGSNTATLSVPIRGDYRPNVYITATLVRGVEDLEPGSVARAFGAVPLFVDRASHRLPLTVKAPEELRSEGLLAVEVDAAPGAVVTIAAVDEGILQLIAQKVADPFGFFYRKRALGVRSFDTFSLLFPEVAEGGGAAGGGAGDAGLAQYVRTDGIRRVRPVTFWSGPLTADSGGKARVEWQLPEFQGALRVMAVSVDADRFGSTEKMARVRDPVVLLPTLPRVLSFGEQLQVPVTVRNDTGKAGDFEVSLTVDGGANVTSGGTQALNIEEGKEKTLYFAIDTGHETGDLKFAFSATGNGERTRSTGVVGMRPDLPLTAEQQVGALAESERVFTLEEGHLRPGTEERQLRLGNVPLMQFSGHLGNLLRYPYGCLEQTVSRAFPLLYLGDLAKVLEPRLLDPEEGDGQDPQAWVEAAVARIGSLQLGSGGFALWPRGDQAEPWASIYAAHFLVEAQRAGYVLDSFLYDKSLSYLSTQVRAKSEYGAGELKRTVYALYVLARAGRGDLGTMDFLRNRQGSSLRPESKSLLAGAFAAVGDSQAVTDLLSNLEAVEEVARRSGGNFDSAIRDRALTLLAVLDAQPESRLIPELVDRLARDARNVGVWTTQETGMALLALGQFFQRQAQRPPASGKVMLGNRTLATFDGTEPLILQDIPGTEPLRVVMEEGYKGGSTFFHLLTRGVPTDDAFQPGFEGLEIERTLLSRDNGSASSGEVDQGDLVVLRTRVRSVAGPVENVVVESLLPSGLEIENPRLETTETLSWVTDANLQAAYTDLRDDRVLVFTSLPANSWQTFYTILRAVAPGSFRLPPVHAEAMYNPALKATGDRGRVEVRLKGGA